MLWLTSCTSLGFPLGRTRIVLPLPTGTTLLPAGEGVPLKAGVLFGGPWPTGEEEGLE